MLIATTLLLLLHTSAWAQQSANENVVYFDLDKPTLNAAGRQTLNHMIAAHKIPGDRNLLLYGYADYLGTRAHNDSLSTERALHVREYLIKKGIPAEHITICLGKGAIARESNAGGLGNARDRKVEIITDAAKMKQLSCQPLEKCAALAWSRNVSLLNTHALIQAEERKITDSTVTVLLPNGDKYTGEIDNDGFKKSGGTYQWASGERYRGDYRNDRKEGQGMYTWPNGDRLDGTWLADEIEAGSLVIPYDGVLYRSDAAHSHSDTRYQGNLQYTGEFVNHMFNGYGMAIWPNGDRYKGDWVNDKMNGKGVYIWSDGERFEGLWVDNKMNGPGTLFNAAGAVVLQGTWINDEFKP